MKISELKFGDIIKNKFTYSKNQLLVYISESNYSNSIVIGTNDYINATSARIDKSEYDTICEQNNVTPYKYYYVYGECWLEEIIGNIKSEILLEEIIII